MNIKQIVEAWLKANGYGGLCNTDCCYDGCGCLLDDLMPCDYASQHCQAGYKGPPTPDMAADGGTWAIYLTKEAAEAAQENSDAK